jgi:hypothetical protein
MKKLHAPSKKVVIFMIRFLFVSCWSLFFLCNVSFFVFSAEDTKKVDNSAKNVNVSLPKKEKISLDSIIAQVNGINILQSDLLKKRIGKEGASYSFKEVALENLFVQKASEKHLLPTKQDIDRQVLSFKNANGMGAIGDEEFEKLLLERGFTLAEYKKQLGYVLATENLKRVEINERIFVTNQEVRECYEKDIPVNAEKYCIKIASLRENQVNDYKKLIRHKKVSWGSSCWLEKDELAQDYLKELSCMKKDQISQVINGSNGFVVLQLVDHKPPEKKEFDDAYTEIEKTIHKEKRQNLAHQLEETMLNQADIIFFKNI